MEVWMLEPEQIAMLSYSFLFVPDFFEWSQVLDASHRLIGLLVVQNVSFLRT
jgi:hypothetical protein